MIGALVAAHEDALEMIDHDEASPWRGTQTTVLIFSVLGQRAFEE
jgi:hypothetical protein